MNYAIFIKKLLSTTVAVHVISHDISPCSHKAEGFNPLCGDQLTLYINVENEVITDIAFKGVGCAISTASASLLTEQLKGKTLHEAEALFEKVHSMLTEEQKTEPDVGKLSVLAGVREYPTRVKCATLAWHTLQAALKQQSTPVTTE